MWQTDQLEGATRRAAAEHLVDGSFASKQEHMLERFMIRWRYSLFIIVAVILCVSGPSIFAQSGSIRGTGDRPVPIFKSKPPVELHGDKPHVLLPNAANGFISVPTFSRSFSKDGIRYPFTIMGSDPTLGGTTNIPARILAVSLRLQNPDLSMFTTVPVDDFVATVLDSPNFQLADYSSGHDLQYADAVQRAQFYSNMKRNWHTNLSPVQVVDHIVVDIPFLTITKQNGRDVPVRTYFQGTASDGKTFTLLLESFFDQQILSVVNKAVNAGQFRTDALNITILPNTYLFEGVAGGRIVGCCVGGFHTYFTNNDSPQRRWVFVYASYMSEGLFSGGTADVTAISHEISEAINDPFVNNRMPAWQLPGIPGTCQDNLETGDPLEALEIGVSPITLRSAGKPFVFHPQTQALWQWFAQRQQSNAIDGAYSYPDRSALVGPAIPFPHKTCPLD